MDKKKYKCKECKKERIGALEGSRDHKKSCSIRQEMEWEGEQSIRADYEMDNRIEGMEKAQEEEDRYKSPQSDE